jgi:hypothetical protein
VRVRVYEPGHYGAPGEVDQARVGAGEAANVSAGADFRDAFARDRHGLGGVQGGVERDHVAAVEHQVGPDHE